MLVSSEIGQLLVAGLTIGGIYALLAIGFHVSYVTMRAVNLAYGAVVVLGGLTAFTLLTAMGMHIVLALVLVLAVGWVLGLVFNRVVVNPVRKRDPDSVIMVLLAAAIILENASALVWGKEALPFPQFGGSTPILVGGVVIMPQSIWILGTAVLVLLLVAAFFEYTVLGKAVRAVANNPTGARLVGMRPESITGYALGLTMALGTLAGLLISPLTFAGGAMAWSLTVKGFTGAILGGISRSSAAILGGLLLGLIEVFAARFVTTGMRDVVVMGILLAVLFLRPEGLFGRE